MSVLGEKKQNVFSGAGVIYGSDHQYIIRKNQSNCEYGSDNHNFFFFGHFFLAHSKLRNNQELIR